MSNQTTESKPLPYQPSEAEKSRQWAAQSAAGILRASSIVSSSEVRPYDVIALAQWLATGEDLNVEEELTVDMDVETAEEAPESVPVPAPVPASDAWPPAKYEWMAGTHGRGSVVRLNRPAYLRIVSALESRSHRDYDIHASVSLFLKDLGVRVEVPA